MRQRLCLSNKISESMRRFRDNYDGRLSAFRWLRSFLVFPPVTVAIDLKDRGMVDDSVDGGNGH